MFAFRRDPGEGPGVAFTDRLGGRTPGPLGPLNLGRCGAEVDGRVVSAEQVAADLDLVRVRLGVEALARVDQVHGTDVVVVDRPALADHPGWCAPLAASSGPVADALVTTLSGVALGVRAADCVPVVLGDRENRVVAAAHAGRVGLLAGVLAETVGAACALGGVRARDLVAWIGPAICGRCYEVDDALAEAAVTALPALAAETTWGTPSLDLPAGAEAQLVAQGLGRVHRVDRCTREHPDQHSHRRDGDRAGRAMGLGWLA